MDDSFALYQHRDNAASPNGSRDTREPQSRRWDGNDLGMTTSPRSVSLPAVSVNTSFDSARERARKRHHSRARPPPPPPPPPPPRRVPHRGRPVESSHPASHHHRRERIRSPNYHANRPLETSDPPPSGRRGRPRDPAPRYDPSFPPERSDPISPSAKPKKDPHECSRPHSHRRVSPSPNAGKRQRRPSPSFATEQPRNDRPDLFPEKLEKIVSSKPQQPKGRRSRSPNKRRFRSPDSCDRRSTKGPRRPGSSRSSDPHRRHRSRSPRGHNSIATQHEGDERHRGRSPSSRYRSARARTQRRSRSRPRNPPNDTARDNRPPTSPDPSSVRVPLRPFSPTSPRARRDPESRQKARARDELQSSRRSGPVSGANSVQVNMAARGSYRGGFNPQMQSGYPSKGQYDARGYGQASGHGTPASSFHGSPSAQSPYGGNGRGWNAQPSFSPQSQYPPPYPHSNYGPPTGPQGHYHHPSQAHSPPYPPNGPSSQYNPGPFRGSHRGGSGAFRGSQFSPARGGPRGGFKSTQWSPQGNSGRSQFTQSDDADPTRGTAYKSPSGHAEPAPVPVPVPDDVRMEDGENPFRPSKDLQVEDTSKDDKSNEEQMPPPSRAPPTGPQSQNPNKFSFSMKNASKPAVTAPRPEISSKFNAAPASRETPSKPAQKAPPTRLERDRDGFPKNVPTEPASARARPSGPSDRRPPEPTRRLDRTPKTRKVKKIVKRLKEKPTLPPELASSKSVFFRKPGKESVVGSGTYGKVFKGQNVYTKKLVALKRIRMEGERDGFPVTAVREIKLLSSLSHKNVVKLQEVMVEMNECFMVFEYLSHDLTGLLNHPTYTLEPAHKKHLAQQLFEGLDYLHTRGVLHRDIKAANILVSNEGVLKLADFGLARFYAKHRRLDYTNRVITIWYRSPELLLGETQYGPAVDIWSAACVLMEIFTKRAIFPGDGGEISQLQKIHAVLGTPNRKDWPGLVDMPWFVLLRPKYRKPSTFEEKYKELLTPAAFDLLTSMFHYDPDKRPTAAEVLQHPYFTTEEPAPRQAIELKDIDGEWHELESKALRREKEKKEKERARAAQSQSVSNEEVPEHSGNRDRDRKRPNDGGDAPREAKRPHIDSNGRFEKAGQACRDLDSVSGRMVPVSPGQSSKNFEESDGRNPNPGPPELKGAGNG